MKVINQYHDVISLSPNSLLMIEEAGRTCYKSEKQITDESAKKFVTMIMERGHHSVIEHANVTVRFVTNRGVTHELVRHRLCAFSQESTRYVDYQKEMEFVRPVWWPDSSKEEKIAWRHSMMSSESAYKALRELGWRPEQAREVLPNSLKTEIIVTANVREWRHIFNLRCTKEAHPQMRELMRPCCEEFKTSIPVIFDDIVW